VLETVTPLCIHSYFDYARLEGEAAYIPATSLRGMARSVVEMVGAGCTRFHSGAGSHANLKRCSPERTCLACHIFGVVGAVKPGFAWQGKVTFHDTDNVARKWMKLDAPISPLAKGSDGWLTFAVPAQPRFREGNIWCVAAKERFGFAVEYEDLDAEEYAL